VVSRNSDKGVDGMNKDMRLEKIMTAADEMRYSVDLNTPISDRQKFEAVTDEAVDTYLQKNADYGASFEADLNEYKSVFPFAYEATKKLRRIKSLIGKDGKSKVKESIRDSIMDIVVYGIMAVMWLDSREKTDWTVFDMLVSKEKSDRDKSALR